MRKGFGGLFPTFLLFVSSFQMLPPFTPFKKNKKVKKQNNSFTAFPF